MELLVKPRIGFENSHGDFMKTIILADTAVDIHPACIEGLRGASVLVLLHADRVAEV